MYSQALRFNAGLKRAIFAVILSVLCIFLYAVKGFVIESFAAPQDETIEGTMSIVLDTTQDPDTPIPSPDPDNPNPNPGDGGNGNNGDNISAGDTSDNDQDALKANSINKDGSNKDSLAGTGDFVTTTLIILLALATVLISCVYVSRRQLATNAGISYSQRSNRVKSVVIVLLAFTLLSGTIFTAFKAFADGEDAGTITNSTATLTSKVVVSKDGKIKSTDLNLTNNLKTAVTVKSISAPDEVSAWTANIDTNASIDAGVTLTKDWTPDSVTIPAELLSKLNNGEEVNLTFSTEVSYTVFNITWNLNGGQGIIATSPVPENGNVVLPSTNPTFNHYTFDGWNTQSDGQGDAVDENTVVTADVTFYAQWTPETYVINYQFPDGGDFAGGVTPEKTYTYGVGVDSFEEPYKQGYDFDGWYDASTGGNKVTSITATEFGDKTLYARWTPSTHTKYVVQHCRELLDEDGAYGILASNDVVVEYGTTGEDTNAQPKSFTGFIVKNIEKEKIAADGNTHVNIFYDRIPYTVTFDNNGKGNATLVPKTVKYMRKLTKPTNTISEAGYIFGGWYATQDCTGSEFDFDNTSITKDITLYAKWTPISYTVKFDKNDAVVTGEMADQSFTYDVAQALRTNTFEKQDYTFVGWAETSTGEVKYTDSQQVKNLANTQGSSVTLYAKWEKMATTFLAPATDSVIANPRNISGTKYSITQLKTAATDIASNGASSSYYSQYKEWMDNDSYHLYTLLKRTDWEYLDSDDADSWCEFRIVHVGQLDSDGTGLTFQAVHMLPTAYQMNSTDTNRGGWASSALRTKMQAGGEIYRMFDVDLTVATYNVTNSSKGKLWLPSYSELTGTSQSSVASDGSQFAYWNGKGTQPTGGNACLSIKGTRSGGSVALIGESGYWWGRSPTTLDYNSVMYVRKYGDFDFAYASNYYGVAPCLSL